MFSPTPRSLDGGRTAPHLAVDSSTIDGAQMQCGVGCGDETGGGAMELDSHLGYVCTLDFPNLTRTQICGACGLKPVLQHGEWSCPYKCGKTKVNLRSIDSHLSACIGPGYCADLYSQCVSGSDNAHQLLRFNANLKAVKQWSLSTSTTSLQGHHSPAAQSARVLEQGSVFMRREGGRDGSGPREGAIRWGGTGASSARSTGVYHHT